MTTDRPNIRVATISASTPYRRHIPLRKFGAVFAGKRRHSLVAERRAGAIFLSGSVQVAVPGPIKSYRSRRYALSTMFCGGFAARQGGHLSMGRLQWLSIQRATIGTPVFQLKTPAERELKTGFS